jgi:programmed cell death 6-interacting protein
LAYLQSAAGALSYLSTEILPLLKNQSWSTSRSSTSGAEGAAGYDMTPSFIGTLQNLVLAQAQECFWQKAVLEGSYKNGIVGRLAMKVADYYGNAVKEANEGIGSAAAFFPQVSRISFSLKKNI